MIKLIPQVRVSERVAEQTVDVAVPLVTQPVPPVRSHKRVREEIADGMQVIPQERVPNFTEAQFGDVPVLKVEVKCSR